MQLYLLLNNNCNLECSFCIRGKHSNNTFLDVNNLKNILRNNDFSHYYLLLTGGEPSLHPKLPEIIDICTPFFKGISINTNGKDSSWIEKCKSNNFHVQISLDGTPYVHNKIRGNGLVDVYGCVMKSIERINAHKISYNISTTVGQNNYDCIIDLCKQINQLSHISYWKVSPVLPFGCANIENILSIDKWNNLVNTLLDIAKVRLKVKRLFDFQLLEKYMKGNPKIDSFSKTNCGDVRYKIYVYPDFTVYPCTCLTDFPLGNLMNETLNKILLKDISQMFINYEVKEDSVCYDCKYLPICNGGCIGMSYHYFKTLGKGDYRCPLIQGKLHII